MGLVIKGLLKGVRGAKMRFFSHRSRQNAQYLAAPRSAGWEGLPPLGACAHVHVVLVA